MAEWEGDKNSIFEKSGNGNENFLQPCFKLCIMLHQFHHVPAEEFIYSKPLEASPNYPTFLWVAGHVLQVISLVFSAYSTVSVPLKDAQIRVFIYCICKNPSCTVFCMSVQN